MQQSNMVCLDAMEHEDYWEGDPQSMMSSSVASYL
jgi:hypothetical protein